MKLILSLGNSLIAWALVLLVANVADMPSQISFFATMFVLMAIDSDIKSHVIHNQKEKLEQLQEPEDAE